MDPCAVLNLGTLLRAASVVNPPGGGRAYRYSPQPDCFLLLSFTNIAG
jgi:hypothetical protein